MMPNEARGPGLRQQARSIQGERVVYEFDDAVRLIVNTSPDTLKRTTGTQHQDLELAGKQLLHGLKTIAAKVGREFSSLQVDSADIANSVALDLLELTPREIEKPGAFCRTLVRNKYVQQAPKTDTVTRLRRQLTKCKPNLSKAQQQCLDTPDLLLRVLEPWIEQFDPCDADTESGADARKVLFQICRALQLDVSQTFEEVCPGAAVPRVAQARRLKRKEDYRPDASMLARLGIEQSWLPVIVAVYRVAVAQRFVKQSRQTTSLPDESTLPSEPPTEHAYWFRQLGLSRAGHSTFFPDSREDVATFQREFFERLRAWHTNDLVGDVCEVRTRLKFEKLSHAVCDIYDEKLGHRSACKSDANVQYRKRSRSYLLEHHSKHCAKGAEPRSLFTSLNPFDQHTVRNVIHFITSVR